MKLAWSLGVASAVVLHGAVVVFGGWFFLDDEDSKSIIQVEVLAADQVADEKDKDKDKPKLEPKEEKDKIEADEEVPDAEKILHDLELTEEAAAPALEAASLGAIEAALNGQGAGGEFASAMSFASGGRIGGTGKGGPLGDNLEDAFTLGEIDQRPRTVFTTAPVYPSELRSARLEGVATVVFVLDAAGKVVNPRIEKSTHTAFEKPALDAIKQWKFEPAIRGGQRVGCKMRQSFRFQPSSQS